MYWSRTVVPIQINSRQVSVTIRLKENGELSFYGCGLNSSGQCLEVLLNPDAKPAHGFTAEMVHQLYDMWDRWHLNYMKAGTPAQEDAVREWEKEHGSYDYGAVCEFLREKDLYVDNGYCYGSKWLKEDVPNDVLQWLFTLPGSGSTYRTIISEITPIDEQDFEAVLAGGA